MARIIIFSAILMLSPLFTKENHLTVLSYQMINNVPEEVRELHGLKSADSESTDLKSTDLKSTDSKSTDSKSADSKSADSNSTDSKSSTNMGDKTRISVKKEITAMEALDIVKTQYAANFTKVAVTENSYYYQLGNETYYLAYEEESEEKTDYLIHLYEFVDEGGGSGIGHTVTYGWYLVDKTTGRITEMLQY